MKNREKYRDIILSGKFGCEEINELIIKNHILPSDCNGMDCGGISCCACHILCNLWLDEEAEEKQVDWSKVPVDAKVLVRDYGTQEWVKRHFSFYKNGRVYTFFDGQSSWTSNGDSAGWQYAKLAEE